VFSETLSYRRELYLGQQITVSVELTALSASGHRWGMQHRISRSEELAASVRLTGGWLSLDTRRLVPPPAELVAALNALPRTEDFGELPDSVREGGAAERQRHAAVRAFSCPERSGPGRCRRTRRA